MIILVLKLLGSSVQTLQIEFKSTRCKGPLRNRQEEVEKPKCSYWIIKRSELILRDGRWISEVLPASSNDKEHFIQTELSRSSSLIVWLPSTPEMEQWQHVYAKPDSKFKKRNMHPRLSRSRFSGQNAQFNLIKLWLDKKFRAKLKWGFSYREMCRTPEFYLLNNIRTSNIRELCRYMKASNREEKHGDS